MICNVMPAASFSRYIYCPVIYDGGGIYSFLASLTPWLSDVLSIFGS